jgi:hypothetical protein
MDSAMTVFKNVIWIVLEAVPGTVWLNFCLLTIQSSLYLQENRKHARLMQKANRLGPQDLLEIAAMKGISLMAATSLPAEPALAAEPPVGSGGNATHSVASCGLSSSSAGSRQANTGDMVVAPATPLAALSELDEDDSRGVTESLEHDAEL